MSSPVTRHLFNSDSMHHAPCSTLRKLSAFTLIELLVVIAIIAILAGLSFPAVQGALNSGKKAKARNEVNQIAAAIKSYQLEYGRLPPSEGLIQALIGGESSDNNRRGITFLEAQQGKGNPPRNGVDAGLENYYDSWGNPYRIELDDDYNNRISADLGTGPQDYVTTVIVSSIGPDVNNDDSPDKPTDVISNMQ